MLSFKRPEPHDRAWADELFQMADTRACEYHFAGVYVWARKYRQEIARFDDFLITRYRHHGKYASYLFPAGRGDLKAALEAICRDAQSLSMPCRVICMTAAQADAFRAARPEGFEVLTDRDGFDYLYRAEKLAGLAGKKLHAKRNHIRRFETLYPDWRFRPMTAADGEICLRLADEWIAEYQDPAEAEDIRAEREALIAALEAFDVLALSGGLLLAGGEPVAFALGALMRPDTFDVLFEKARASVQGAYAAINREFARHLSARCPQLVYINREDDMGLPGLRKAKLSYEPDILLEKYYAQPIGSRPEGAQGADRCMN